MGVITGKHPMSSPLRLWSPLTQPVYKLNEYEIYVLVINIIYVYIKL